MLHRKRTTPQLWAIVLLAVILLSSSPRAHTSTSSARLDSSRFVHAAHPGDQRTPQSGQRERKSQQQFHETSWQNWWALNQGHYLDLERRLHAKGKSKEENPDLFTGDTGDEELGIQDDRHGLVQGQALPTLKKFLDHNYFAVRMEAALAIGRLGNADQVSWLLPLLKDKNKQVRQSAILGLGLLKSDRAVPILKRVMKGKASLIDERSFAAVAMGMIGTDDSAEFLIAGLRGKKRVREIDAARLYALGLAKTKHARLFLEYYVKNPLHDTALRAVALDALGMHGDIASLNTIMRGLQDKDVWVRRSAATAIGQVNFTSRYREEWNELNLEALDASKAPERLKSEFEAYKAGLRSRMEADEILLAKKKSDVVAKLKEPSLNDADILVRNFLAIALGEIGSADAVSILGEMLKTAKLNSTKAYAALGLAIQGDESSARLIAERLKEKRLDPETKAAFYLALGLSGHKFGLKEVKGSFKSVGDTALAKYTAISLAMMGDKDLKEPLHERLVQKSRPELKRAYGEAAAVLADAGSVKFIKEALNARSSVNHRVQLLDALSAIQNEESLAVLLDFASTKKLKDLTLAATLRAIGRVGEKGELPILAETFRHLNYPLDIVVLNQIAAL